MHVEVDTRDFDRLKHDLEVTAKRAVPHAARNAVNRCAFEARAGWVAETRSTFVQRNTFTERSLQVDKARGTDMASMAATVGSTADYMARREDGELKGPKHGKHVAIPTVSGARGGAITSPIRKPNRLSAIRLAPRPGSTSKQRNAIAIRMARAKGQRFAFLETPRGGGIVRVLGGKRKGPVRMVWDLSRGAVRIKPMPSLQRTLTKLGPRFVAIHEGAILEQLKRNKVLGY